MNQNNELIFICDENLDIEAEYGLKCGCYCPECGEPVVAIRRNVNTKCPEWSHFAHQSNSDCVGSRETNIHLAAKYVGEQCIGKTMLLPSMTVKDAHAHISSYSSGGRRSKTWNLAIDGTCDVVRASEEVEIVSVVAEKAINNALGINLVPDMIFTVKNHDGNVYDIAVEIRCEHPKSLIDVQKYEQLKLNVIEIYVKDLKTETASESIKELEQRILGCEHNVDEFREYLYSPFAEDLTRDFAVRIQDESPAYASFLAARDIFSASIGKTFTLPPVGVYDAIVKHNDDFSYEPFAFNCRQAERKSTFEDFSSFNVHEYGYVPNIILFGQQEWTVSDVLIDYAVNDVEFPLVLALSNISSKFMLPVEFYGAPGISEKDIKTQAQCGQSVLGINLIDVLAKAGNLSFDIDSLFAKVLLTDIESKYWAYNRAARPKADRELSLWYNLALYDVDEGLQNAFARRYRPSIAKQLHGADVYNPKSYPCQGNIVLETHVAESLPVCKTNNGKTWYASQFYYGVRRAKPGSRNTWSIYEGMEMMYAIDAATRNATGRGSGVSNITKAYCCRSYEEHLAE